MIGVASATAGGMKGTMNRWPLTTPPSGTVTVKVFPS